MKIIRSAVCVRCRTPLQLCASSGGPPAWFDPADGLLCPDGEVHEGDEPVAAVAVLVRRFQCPFCRRTRSRRPAAEAHIARCWVNPGARSCKTCSHYDPGGPADNQDPGSPEGCAAGLDLRTGLRTGCPKWQSDDQ